MAFIPDTRAYPGAPAASQAAALDAGLRSYMLRVYNWMASGLVLTGVVAYGIVNVPALFDAFYPLVQTPRGFVHTPGALAYIAMFAPLAFTLVLSIGINKLSTATAQALYWAFCVAMGASLTSIFLVYTHQSIAEVFFIAAATFASMSIYGYTTRADLTKLGSFCMMGLFGVGYRDRRQHVHPERGDEHDGQHHRRAGVRGADGVRHAAHQVRLRQLRLQLRPGRGR